MEGFSLSKDGSSSLGIRKISAVPNTPNIAVFLVPQSSLVTIEKTCRITNARISDVGMSTHWRDNMEQIKFLDDLLLRICILKSGLVFFNFDQRMLKCRVDVIAGCYLGKGLSIFRDTKHHTDRFDELN